MYKHTGLVLGAVIVLQACSNSSIKQNAPANVTSSPSGAAVYANGLKIGETPLHTDLYKAFPASWNDLVYQAAGVLLVKKPGCNDFALKVNDYILSQPIYAKLECQAVKKSDVVVPAVKAKQIPEKKVDSKADKDIETRLRKLDELNKKGLITTDEYNATKIRILNDL